AVGTHKIVGHDAARAIAGIDAIDVAGPDLARRAVAFVVAVDAVGGVGEPDRAICLDDRVVRAVQALALEAIRDHRDGAVVLRAGDPPVAMLTGDEAAGAVHGVAIGVPRRLAEGADDAGGLVPAQQAVVGDVA